MLTEARVVEAETVIDRLRTWAVDHDEVRGLALVGSWARDTARMDSDIDIVVLTEVPSKLGPEVLLQLLGDGHVVRRKQWGPVSEVRVELSSGFEVEIGVAPLRWADVDPVDAGTYRVMNDGHRILHDPDRLLAALSLVCR